MEPSITASVETEHDYEETAGLATIAFGRQADPFDPARFAWFYERAFSEGATVVRLTDERTGQKIGQIAMVNHAIATPGGIERASALVDLFILPDYRGGARLQTLYDTVGEQFQAQSIRFGLGMPNKKALPVNERFFQLMAYRRLDLRGGLQPPALRNKVRISEEVTGAGAERITELFAPFATSPSETGLIWDGSRMAARLANPGQHYGFHATDNLALISSPRRFKNVPVTLLIGFFVRQGARPRKRDIKALVTSATALWRRPAFIYAGLHRSLPALPGWPFPERLRFSPMVLQLRDFASEREPLDLDRFQLIDFDFG
ncbi:hypothetical protein B7H23_02865 [Notoacmeibacter marinus]|uniref:Uncharacterized protein n=1 Tax=Notoacmeibacter marinus TaxID=1876515 RepID=A0A231V132_9HYPH|nr:GNAT family N-acetyltransferase [Notoacmeibacter marinus]OXT01903.1 hypothetical protein B7H23_02865 [Notoacmeibacter marinus]